MGKGLVPSPDSGGGAAGSSNESKSLFSGIDKSGVEIGVSVLSKGIKIQDSGDGSDDDLQEVAEAAAEMAKAILHSACSNAGMDALADLIDEAIDIEAEGLPDGIRPNSMLLFAMIHHVHSPATARSCMTEGIEAAVAILMEAYETIKAHEIESEGVDIGD